MANEQFTDPTRSNPPLHEDTKLERVETLEKSNNAMWGWIAGGAVLTILLVFVFARGPGGTDTATTNMPPRPAETTGMSTPRETTGPSGATIGTPIERPATPAAPSSPPTVVPDAAPVTPPTAR